MMTDRPAIGPTDSELYRRLVDSVRDYAIIALDAAGDVVTWNSGAERFAEYTPAEAIGKHFSTFFTEKDLAVHKPRQLLETAIRDGRAEDEEWLVRKDGSRFYGHLLFTALRDETT